MLFCWSWPALSSSSTNAAFFAGGNGILVLAHSLSEEFRCEAEVREIHFIFFTGSLGHAWAAAGSWRDPRRRST